MNHSRLIPLHLVLILSTAIIITARPNILQYERIRKYRYSVGEVTTSKSSQEPLIDSSATYKTTTSLSNTIGNDYHDQERLYTSNSPSSNSINHISYDDFINLTCQEEEEEHHHENNHDPSLSSATTKNCYLHDDSSSSQNHNNHDNHTNTNKLHRTFLRIPTTISASKVILESEELNEDHLFESYIYS